MSVFGVSLIIYVNNRYILIVLFAKKTHSIVSTAKHGVYGRHLCHKSDTWMKCIFYLSPTIDATSTVTEDS